MDYRAHLLDMIEKLLAGEWSVEEFRKNYYDYYLEVVPDNALSDEDRLFLGYVQEMLDQTANDLDEEHRKHGWMSNEEYIAWVRKDLEAFLMGKYDPSGKEK